MKTIVALSDSHGGRGFFDEIAGVLGEADMIIHLGDYSSDGLYLKKRYPDKTIILNGNCEMHGYGSDEIVTECGGVKIFACHGHLYSVKTTLEKLAARAKELGCALALYGHTHVAAEDEIDGVTLFNPGTCSQYSRKSYGYIVISGNKAVVKAVYAD